MLWIMVTKLCLLVLSGGFLSNWFLLLLIYLVVVSLSQSFDSFDRVQASINTLGTNHGWLNTLEALLQLFFSLSLALVAKDAVYNRFRVDDIGISAIYTWVHFIKHPLISCCFLVSGFNPEHA